MSPEHQGGPFGEEKVARPLHRIKAALPEYGQADLDLYGRIFDKICFFMLGGEQSFRRAPENGIF
jgi:hypothetical protein